MNRSASSHPSSPMKRSSVSPLRSLWSLGFMAVGVVFSIGVQAQPYPNKPIRFVVPYPAGGPLDTVARLLGQKVSESAKQPVIVDNKPGAGGNIGADAVAKAPADGYTILMGAVPTAKRSVLAPDLPTIAESGLPGFDISTWFGVFVPAGTPRDVVERLHMEFTKALAMPDIRERMLVLGAEPAASRPEEFAAYIRAEADKYARVIKASGAKAD